VADVETNMESTYNYTVFDGTAANPPTGAYVVGDWTGIAINTFATGTKILMVWVHDNRLVIRFAFTGVAWGDDIVLYDAPQAEPFYLSAQSFQVQNFVNGSLALYQVMGQW